MKCIINESIYSFSDENLVLLGKGEEGSCYRIFKHKCFDNNLVMKIHHSNPTKKILDEKTCKNLTGIETSKFLLPRSLVYNEYGQYIGYIREYKDVKYPTIRTLKIGKVINEFYKLEKDVRVLNKLYFIRACYHNDNIPEVAKEQDLPISTAYRWINEWNEGGYEGLKPKYCGGKKPGLNYDDKLKLFEILYFKDVVTTEIVHQTIKEEFGIDYSKKQAREIAKSIGFTFSSSYPVNVEVDPKKVKKFFDEVAELDYFNQIIGFLDQTACQDSSNVPKTLNLRGSKNRMKKHGVKIRQTAMGFQAINGNPALSFPKNSRSPNMIRFAAEIRKNNVENKDLIPLIDLIFSNDNLDEENIIKILDKDLIDLEGVN